MNRYNAIDLFCGCGGLTEGLKKAGFNVIAGVEIDGYASKTYHLNHPEVVLIQDNIVNVTGSDILNKTKVEQIDLLTGCPPCQGFSSLTYKHKKNDSRNQLILEIVRLAKELSPKIIMLENVSGLAKGKKANGLFQDFLKQIEDLGYYINFKIFEVAEFGVPQYRKRLVLFASKDRSIKLPEPTHGNDDGLQPFVTAGEILNKVKSKPKLYTKSRDSQNLINDNWHVVRSISNLNKERLRYAKPGKSWEEIPEYIRPKCHQDGYKGFTNVYGRINPNQPSSTITRGCTSPSMGRFGHPTQLRTISIREAALLQTFPDNYKFAIGNIEEVCKVIGNALPCLFAEIISKNCYLHLNDL